MQVIFTALYKVEDTTILKVDMRRSCALFSTMVVSAISFPSSIPTLFTSQIKAVAIAVQVNSAAPLIETLTARGGMVISAQV